MRVSGKICVPALAALLLCAACVSIDYEGDSKEAKAKRSDVKVYMDKAKIEVQGWKPMGEATISAPEGFTASELETRLVDFAKAKGADGLLILSVEKSSGGNVRQNQLLNVETDCNSQLETSERVSIKAQLLEFPKREDDFLSEKNFEASLKAAASGKGQAPATDGSQSSK